METETMEQPVAADAGLTPVFRLGALDVEPALQGKFEIDSLLARHAACDWGEFSPELAWMLPKTAGRLVSLYLVHGAHIAVETEWDCSGTWIYRFNPHQDLR